MTGAAAKCKNCKAQLTLIREGEVLDIEVRVSGAAVIEGPAARWCLRCDVVGGDVPVVPGR